MNCWWTLYTGPAMVPTSTHHWSLLFLFCPLCSLHSCTHTIIFWQTFGSVFVFLPLLVAKLAMKCSTVKSVSQFDVQVTVHRDKFLSCSEAVWHIPLLCVQWKTPDDRQRNCLKHVEFYSKNKFEKSVRLVGFIIRSVSQHLFCVFQLASKAICICGVAFFCQVSWSVCTTCRANSWSSCSVRWVTLLWCVDSLQKKSDSACLVDVILCICLETFTRPILTDMLPCWRVHQLVN